MGERIDGTESGAWQMPQGGVDDNEDIVRAAFREMKEEIGTDKAEIIRIHPETIKYDIPDDVRSRLSWGRTYIGQEQTWVALRFVGNDSDIKLDDYEHPEFARFKWVELAEVVKLIVPFKVRTYEQVVRIFSDISK